MSLEGLVIQIFSKSGNHPESVGLIILIVHQCLAYHLNATLEFRLNNSIDSQFAQLRDMMVSNCACNHEHRWVEGACTFDA